MWPNPQFSADLATFTEEILNGKLYFLCYENMGEYIPVVNVITTKAVKEIFRDILKE